MDEITVYRDFPVIAGYVQVPPNREAQKTSFTPAEFEAAVPDSVRTRLPHPGTNPNTGRKFGSHEFMRVPGQTFAISL